MDAVSRRVYEVAASVKNTSIITAVMRILYLYTDILSVKMLCSKTLYKQPNTGVK